jgi:multisubunit Na+/H+ antiporter MnhG subunit
MWMKPGSLTTLISNLSAVSSASGMDSGSALNPRRFTLINVDTLIPQALYSIPVMAIVYAIIASVSAIAVVRAVRAGDTRMAVAVVASATVLVGYHRFYDAQILWLGIPAMLLVVQGRMSLVLRAGYGVFLIPGQTMAALWLNARRDGPWSFLLLHHQTLACVMIWLIFAVTAIKLGEGQHERGLASSTDSSIT